MSDLRKEFGRKAFHQLSLVYLGAFHLIGWPAVRTWMFAWLALVLAVETARLYAAPVARGMLAVFGGLIREAEHKHYSGILWTTAGSLAAMLIGRGDALVVNAAVLQLALAGKAFGRVKLFGGRKTLEGSLAGFAVGYAAALACGARPGAAFAAAAAGSLVEVLPTTPWFNDNMWIPIATAAAITIAGPR